jgi:hypothetical protein
VKLTHYRRSESVSSAAMRDISASVLAISTLPPVKVFGQLPRHPK